MSVSGLRTKGDKMIERQPVCPGWPAAMKDDRESWRVTCAEVCRQCREAAGCAHSVRVAAGYVDADPRPAYVPLPWGPAWFGTVAQAVRS